MTRSMADREAVLKLSNNYSTANTLNIVCRESFEADYRRYQLLRVLGDVWSD